MPSATYTSALLAFAGACVLLASGLGLALEGAGPYGSLPAVRFGVVAGATSAYFLVLWVASRASFWMRGIHATARRNVALGVLSIAAGTATFLAPLLPSALLAAVCRSEALCPQAANPILWSYLKLVTDLPLPPFLVGVAIVLASAFILGKRRASNAG